MTLIQPAAWMFALFALPLIGLYILKVKRRRRTVSTLLFWNRIFGDKKPRALFERLRHWLSLLIQLAILLALVLALSEPVLDSELDNARRVVLVLDNSASMGAVDGDGTRFDRARAIAETTVSTLGAADEMAIVTGGGSPRIAVGFTGHARTLRGVLAGLDVIDAPTRIAEAVALARQFKDRDESIEIIVLSDGGFETRDTLATSEDVNFVLVGDPVDNVAITNFQVRRSVVVPTGIEILVAVRNFGRTTATFRLEIMLEEQPVDVIPVELAPGAVFERTLEKNLETGGVLLAAISPRDGFPLDDTARALLPRRQVRRVALGPTPHHYVRQVFEALPLVVASPLPPGTEAPAGSTRVYEKKIPNILPSGDILVLDPESSCDLFTVGDALAEPLVARQKDDHPLLRNVHLTNVGLPGARRLTASTEATVIASGLDDSALILAYDRPTGRVVVIAGDLERGDLPLRTAFPIMISNALSWFSDDGDTLAMSEAAGGLARVNLPRRLTTAENISATGPDGGARVIDRRGAIAEVGPLDRVGIWSIADAAAPEDRPARFAVNLANPIESDLSAAAGSDAPRQLAGRRLAGLPVWMIILLFVAASMIAEWCLFQRRRIR